MAAKPHPLDQLNASEIRAVAGAVNEYLMRTNYVGKTNPPSAPRFNVITLAEPAKADLLAMAAECTPAPPRQAGVIFITPTSCTSHEALVDISIQEGVGLTADVVTCLPLAAGVQPLLSPDDCDLAESIVKLDAGVARLLKERYGIVDMGACERVRFQCR